MQIAAADFILVVQRHIGDRRAADENRFHARHRRDGASATDLHVDGQQAGRHLLWRKLVRDRPARFASPEPEGALQLQAVDLVDDAVDLEWQFAALDLDLFVECREFRRATRDPALAVDRQP